MAANVEFSGSRRVRAIRPAFADVKRISPKMRDAMLIRRQALKLRFWPEKHPIDEGGNLLDLDWSWIRALAGLKVGELRLHDTIAGNDNLRIIFFEGDSSIRRPLPLIWVLRVMQKKRNEFTSNDLNTFKARRTLVIERFYNHRLS